MKIIFNEICGDENEYRIERRKKELSVKCKIIAKWKIIYSSHTHNISTPKLDKIRENV